jgi:hypothetical protein
MSTPWATLSCQRDTRAGLHGLSWNQGVHLLVEGEFGKASGQTETVTTTRPRTQQESPRVWLVEEGDPGKAWRTLREKEDRRAPHTKERESHGTKKWQKKKLPM